MTNYVIWDKQEKILNDTKSISKEAFARLDRNLIPTIFILGILSDEVECCEHSIKKLNSIYLYPKDCGYDIGQFSDVWELTKKYIQEDSEKNIRYSVERAQRGLDQAIKARSLAKAVEQIIRTEDISKGKFSYCLLPYFINDYWVFFIFQFDRQTILSHHLLTKNGSADPYDRRWFPRATSLPHALSSICQYEGFDLRRSSKIYNHDYIDRILYDSGSRLMDTAIIAGRGVNSYLYRNCNQLSAMKYESQECQGKMLIAIKNHPKVEVKLPFSAPVNVGDIAVTRKLLETSKGDLSLVSDGDKIYGLGVLLSDYDPQEEGVFQINFKKQLEWAFLHNNNILMEVSNTIPSFPTTLINEKKYYDLFRRIFKDIPQNPERLLNLAINATKQRHGTMLVIAENAGEEANRLKDQNIQFKESLLYNELMEFVTSIDGAVLLDPLGNCHAIGVILDGLASDKGSTARGSRYNSAVRYIETQRKINKKYQTLIVVISEDGAIDLLPNLKPQISRQTLQEIMELLESINGEERPNIVDYNKIMGCLISNRFYLSLDQCDKINTIKRSMEKKQREINRIEREPKLEPGAGYVSHVVWEDLAPDVDMDDSYFSD